jgi:hypothetical protein
VCKWPDGGVNRCCGRRDESTSRLSIHGRVYSKLHDGSKSTALACGIVRADRQRFASVFRDNKFSAALD